MASLTNAERAVIRDIEARAKDRHTLPKKYIKVIKPSTGRNVNLTVLFHLFHWLLDQTHSAESLEDLQIPGHTKRVHSAFARRGSTNFGN